MNGFALLWSKILDSSLWITGSKETRLLWVAMLAMKDWEGKIQASIVGLADRAKISLDECKSSLEELMSPDPNDTSGVDEGRRIRQIPGGWQIINHDLYRFSTEAKRETWRAQQAAYRAKKKGAKRQKKVSAEYLERENRYVKASNDGDEAKCDEIAAEGLPG